jgi:hypothetical protein
MAPNGPCGRGKNFLHVVETGSGAHPASNPMGTGGSFPGVKRQGREADHSPPTSATVNKMCIYTSTPHTPSWCSVQLVKHKDTFTLTAHARTKNYSSSEGKKMNASTLKYNGVN